MYVIYLWQWTYHCVAVCMYVNARCFNLSTRLNMSVHWVYEPGRVSCVHECGCLYEGVGLVAYCVFQRWLP